MLVLAVCVYIQKCICATFIITNRDPGQEESGEGGLAKTWANDGDDVRKCAL